MNRLCVKTIAAAVALSSAIAFCEGVPRMSPDAAPSLRKPASEAYGGFVTRPLTADAKFITIDDRRAEMDDAPEKFIARVVGMMHLASRIGTPQEGDIALMLIDGGDFAVFPEKTAATIPNGETSEETQSRLMSALLRIIGIEGDKFGPQVMGTALAQARRMRIGDMRRSTYRKAVEEGWAPPPTNDVQRAVWDSVKAGKDTGK